MHQAAFPPSLHLGGSVQVKERIKVVETRRLDAKRAHRGKTGQLICKRRSRAKTWHIHRIEPVPLSDISALPATDCSSDRVQTSPPSSQIFHGLNTAQRRQNSRVLSGLTSQNCVPIIHLHCLVRNHFTKSFINHSNGYGKPTAFNVESRFQFFSRGHGS